MIVDLIKMNPEITRKQIAESIGKSVKTIERIIGDNPKIKYVGPSKGGHWEVE